MTYTHQVLMLCPLALREQAAPIAAQITGDPRDATPSFWSRLVGDGEQLTHGLALTAARAATVEALAELAPYFPGALYWARTWSDPLFDVPALLQQHGLRFMDEDPDPEETT